MPGQGQSQACASPQKDLGSAGTVRCPNTGTDPTDMLNECHDVPHRHKNAAHRSVPQQLGRPQAGEPAVEPSPPARPPTPRRTGVPMGPGRGQARVREPSTYGPQMSDTPIILRSALRGHPAPSELLRGPLPDTHSVPVCHWVWQTARQTPPPSPTTKSDPLFW